MHEGQGERKEHWRRARADHGMNEEPERVAPGAKRRLCRGLGG